MKALPGVASFALVLADFATDGFWKVDLDVVSKRNFFFFEVKRKIGKLSNLAPFDRIFVLSKGDERVGRINSVTKFPFTTNDYAIDAISETVVQRA